MRVAEMAGRGEDVFAVLAATLAQLWPEHEVMAGAQPGGQVWWLHPQLSLCASGPGPRARSYLRRCQRWSHRPARVVPQLLASQVLASRVGRRLSRRAAFTVVPALPNARDLLVMPSNQRVRLLDFARGRTLVAPKVGFPADGIRTELDVRRGEGPWPPTVPVGDGFEEPLLDGWSLPRRPPWRASPDHAAEALRAVEAWQAADVDRVPAGEWAERRARALQAQLVDASWALPPLPLDGWVDQAAALGTIEVSRTHGDLQPGNIFLTRDDRVVVIDWERADRRWRPYDRWVLEHGARWGGVPPPSHDTRSAAAGAMFWLEDLWFYAQDAAALPFEGTPPSLRHRVEAACAWS